MTKLNLGKFNLKSNSIINTNISGISDVEVTSDISDIIVLRDSGTAESDVEMITSAVGILRRHGTSEDANIELQNTAVHTLLKFSGTTVSDIDFDSTAIGALLGSDLLQYNKGLVLRPGDIMEIDLCDYTVTINGANALHTEDDGGKWFELYPGMNYLEITTNGIITADIFWKDRWL